MWFCCKTENFTKSAQFWSHGSFCRCPSRLNSWSFTISYLYNDIVKCIGASIRLFADDTSLYIKVDLPDQAAIILNTDLKTISDWANSWLVAFNASKTLSVIFSRKSNPVVHPSLFRHDTMINETTNHKHLGLILSNICSLTEHINSISD